jgi:poly(3-hydroxybutyrate) depolymerase
LVVPLALLAGLTIGCGSTVEGPIPLRATDSTALVAPAGERMLTIIFSDPDGGTVSAVLREPEGASSPSAAVVLVAGRETGEHAAAVIPGPLEQSVLALEYPDALPETFSPATVLPALRRVRRSALRMPGLLRGAAAWLATRESVDPGRVILVGVSYGVPFAAAAGVDTLFRGVALHHGGADLALLLRSNLPIENGLARTALARWGAWYFRAIEPARHVGRVAPRPLLLINGTADELIPRASAERLLASARDPVRQIWLPHGHLMPGDFAHMRELADSTLSHFAFLRAGAGP